LASCPSRSQRRLWLFQSQRIGAETQQPAPGCKETRPGAACAHSLGSLVVVEPHFLCACVCIYLSAHVYGGQRTTLTVVHKVPLTFCCAGTSPKKWVKLASKPQECFRLHLLSAEITNWSLVSGLQRGFSGSKDPTLGSHANKVFSWLFKYLPVCV
ncbi:mCG1030551, isoform CRA_a, partial [Mus musculus]